MADQLNTVKIVEVSYVAPTPPPQPGSSDVDLSLPLTFFDLLWLRFPRFHRLFFYQIPSSSSSSSAAAAKLFFHSTIIPNLKSSLSTALQHFLPLAGNITWPHHSPNPTLKYVQGDAVSFTVAESTADFRRLISSNTLRDIEVKEYHPLVPKLETSPQKAAVVSFQITLFPSSCGFAVGTTMHHAALDGKPLFLFLKIWTHICKHQLDHDQSDFLLPDELKPVLDKTLLQDPTGLDLKSIYLNRLLNMDHQPNNNRSLMIAPQYKCPADFFSYFRKPLVLPDSIQASFEFTTVKIEQLRQSVIKKQQREHHQSIQFQNLSTFCITCAYTWVCLVKAEQEINCDKIVMVVSVDCRSRFEPALPENYFGNCTTARLASAERKALLGEDGLVMAVEALTESIKGLNNGVLLEGAENLISILYPSDRKAGGDGEDVRVFSTAGSHRFKMYETDFGWGRPKCTEGVTVGRGGAITFSDGRNGGGAVEIGLVLRKQHMQGFATLFAQGLQNL